MTTMSDGTLINLQPYIGGTTAVYAKSKDQTLHLNGWMDRKKNNGNKKNRYRAFLICRVVQNCLGTNNHMTCLRTLHVPGTVLKNKQFQLQQCHAWRSACAVS